MFMSLFRGVLFPRCVNPQWGSLSRLLRSEQLFLYPDYVACRSASLPKKPWKERGEHKSAHPLCCVYDPFKKTCTPCLFACFLIVWHAVDFTTAGKKKNRNHSYAVSPSTRNQINSPVIKMKHSWVGYFFNCLNTLLIYL